MKGVVVPVLGLGGGRLTGLTSHALVPRTVRSLVDIGALSVTHHTPLLPVCGLSGRGLSLRNATDAVGVACALRVTVRGLDDCKTCSSGRREARCDWSQSHGSRYRSRGRHPFPLTVRSLGKGVSGLGGVARIARWQLLPPGIATTLSREWSLPCGCG